MPDILTARYSLLLAEASEAYRVDSSYAQDMANQANILRARQEARRERTEVDFNGE